jgi:hypothetical protein
LEGNGYPAAVEHAPLNTESDQLTDEMLDKLRILHNSGLDNNHGRYGMEWKSAELERGESSAWAAGRAHQSQSTHRCEACRNETHFSALDEFHAATSTVNHV